MAMMIRNWMISDTNADEELWVMRNKNGALCARAADINTQLEYEEMQPGRKRRHVVGNWLRNVEEMQAEVEFLEQDVRKGVYSSRKKLKKEIRDLTGEIEDLMDEGKFHDGLTLEDHASSSVPLVTTKLKGRMFEENLKMILSWLTEEDVCRIGVYGLGGVGKTTLAKHIHNKLHEEYAKSSVHVYWVTVSQETTIATLQIKIAKAAKVEHLLFGEDDETKRAAKLFAALKKRKKVVLFLDDMWKHFEAEKVGVPVGKDECKLVITTRSLDVCRRMECKRRVKVEPLSKEESWELFVETLGSYDDLSLEVTDLAKLVARKCAGLPLGILTMAASMREKTDIHEWSNTLDELSDSVGNNEDMEMDVLRILKLSYERLSDVMLQKCFLNCALFPEDSKLSRIKLIDFWVADCLLEDIESREKQLDKGHTILNKLINVSLLESSDVDGNFVKMHDLIREMATKIGRETHHFMIRSGLLLTKVPDLREWKEELIKVSLISNRISEIESNISPKCPCLSTLLLQENPLKFIPDLFFSHMKSLRCLSLTQAPIKKLPDNISELENLSALIVSCCSYLIYVPSLMKLVKLRELDLSFNDNLEDLPLGIETLPNLRFLRLTNSIKHSVPFSSLITGLSQIEHMEFGYGIKDVEGKLLMELQYLKRLKDCWMTNVSDFNHYVKSQHFKQLKNYEFYISPTNSTHIQSLIGHYFTRIMIIHEYGKNQDGKIDPITLPNNIQFLQLIHADVNIRSLLDVLPSIHSLTSLTRVWIGNCEGLEYVWPYASSETEPRNLGELNLSELPNLKWLTKPGINPFPSAFYNIKKFTMEYCWQIKTLFTPCLLNQLQNLEVLEIQVCQNLTEIMTLSEFHEDTEGAAVVSEVTREQDNTTMIYLPKLRELLLVYLPNLETLCSKGLVGFDKIEVITVIHCPLLKKLPFSFPVLENGEPSGVPISLKKMIVQKQWWEEVVEWDHLNYANLLEPLIEFSGDSD